MDRLTDSILFTLIVIALLLGVWTWLLVLFKKGPRGLLGFNRVIVQKFENVLVYKNGVYERALAPGAHWIRAGNLQLIGVDMRPKYIGLLKELFRQIILRSISFALPGLRFPTPRVPSKLRRTTETRYLRDYNLS